MTASQQDRARRHEIACFISLSGVEQWWHWAIEVEGDRLQEFRFGSGDFSIVDDAIGTGADDILFQQGGQLGQCVERLSQRLEIALSATL